MSGSVKQNYNLSLARRDGGDLQLPDLVHELLHVFFLLKDECPQILEGNVGLHILGIARVFDIDLRNEGGLN